MINKTCRICEQLAKEMHYVEGKVLKVSYLYGEEYPPITDELIRVPGTIPIKWFSQNTWLVMLYQI